MEHNLTCIHVDLDILEENFAQIKARAQGKVLVVVKADAYGHGAIQVAQLLEGKCDFFGVSSVAEALELQQGGCATPILVLGYAPADTYDSVLQHSIRIPIFSLEDAKALSQAAEAAGQTAYIHLAVDTGMGRIGFSPTEESAQLCHTIAKLPGLCIEGLFSHFATADQQDLSLANRQLALFDEFDARLKALGIHIPLRHIDNSAGIINFPGRYEMVRSGIITYGMYPSDQVDKSLLSVRPALSWHSLVTHVKTLPEGTSIGYGATYITHRETVVATVAAGYADGYRRNLSGKFHVLIHGKPAPILGRICMDQMMVDVTHIPDVRVCDCVTLIGDDKDQSITVEQIAAAADSFNYEFVCGLSRRVPKLYYQNGQQVAQVHHLPVP